MAIGSVQIDVEARLAKFESDIGKAARVLEREMGRSAAQTEAALRKVQGESRRTADALQNISSTADRVGPLLQRAFSVAAVLEFGRRMIEASNQLKGFEQGLTAATGSAEQARRDLNYVRVTADELGVSFTESARGFTTLSAAAKDTILQGQGVRDVFKSVTEAGRVLNLSTEQVGGAITAISQMMSKGKVQAEELRGQLGERIPGAFNLAAKAMGVTTAELDAMLKKGEVVASDFLPKFAAQLHKVYGEQAKIAAQNPAADFERLGNAITAAFARIGNESGLMTALAAGARLLTSAIGDSVSVILSWTRYIGDWVGEVTNYFAELEKSGSVVGKVMGAYKAIYSDILAFLGRALAELPINLKTFGVIALAEMEKFVITAGASWDALHISSAKVWAAIANTASVAWGEIRAAFGFMVDGIVTNLRGLLDTSASMAQALGLDTLAAKYAAASQALETFAGNEAAARDQLRDTNAMYQARVTALDAEGMAIKANADARKAAVDRVANIALEERDAALKAMETSRQKIALDTKVGESIKGVTEATAENAKGQAEGDRAARAYGTAMDRLADIADRARKEMGPLAKALAEHDIRLRDIERAENAAVTAAGKMKNAKDAEAAAHKLATTAITAESAAYQKNVTEAKKTLDIAGPILKQLREQAAGAWLSDRDAAGAQAVDELRQAYERLGVAADELERPLSEVTEQVNAQALATYDAQKAAEFWRSTWDNAVDGVSRAIGDFAVRNIKTWKDFGKAMLDVVKQTVASIITEFAKTKILQFFAGTGGGGGGSFWGSLAAMGASMLSSSGGGGGGGSSASGSGSAQGTGGFQYQGASGGGGIGLDTMQTLYKGYKMLFGGGGTGYAGSAAYANAAMYGPPADMAPGFMGPPAAYSTPGPYGSMGGYGTAAAWGGGLLGAMYGYRRGDGSVLGTGGSTVAYGALGMGIAGTAAGMAGGLSAGAAAGGAFSAIGAMSWIPIVGWIAAIAAVVDKVSGGKVFGTKYRPETATTTVALGQDGATINASLVEWKYRNQASQAFGRIGGALLPSDWGDKDHRVTQIAITPEMQRAADAFFKSISQVMIKVAKATGDETASMIDAALIVRQEFDKKGKLKKTHYIAEIFGKQYEEETAELAQIRIQAEAAIAQLQVNSIASGASAIAEKYRGSAEALLDVSATMTQATSDIVHGVKLLAGGDTLESIMEYVEGIQQAGEAVSQTYMRLAEASKQYQSIMAQITDALDAIRTGDSPSRRMEQSIKAWEEQTKATVDQLNAAAEAAGLMGAKEEDLAKARELSVAQLGKMTTDFFGGIDAQILGIDGHATPASDFAAAMRGIDVQLNENIKIANSLARAAGLSGASEQQLAKIHELAARQAAAAIRQLENVGRQQARSLYGGANTLQDVEADIAALEADMQAASTSLGDFSGAITDVADAASAAMRLLLGDLSPLNDQQKLQTALGGLSAGTASREDVLTIGRRLYASSAAYTALFNQVMAMPDKVAQATGGGPGGGTSSTSRQYHGTATLAELYQKRDAMNAAQRINEARDLAETVAALAKSKDETFEQIAAELGFSLDDLAKDLGLSYEGLQDYLGKIDVNASAVADSFTENMDRLLAKLDEIFGTGPQFTPIDEGEVPAGSEADGTVPRHFQDLPNGEAHIQQMTETTEMVGRMTRDAIADMAQAFREMAQAQREISQFNMPRGIREGGGVLVR